MSKKNILIYGATGSIGDATLNLIRNNKNDFNVVGLTCDSNIDKLIKLSYEFSCNNIGISEISKISKYPELKNFNLYAGLNEFINLVDKNVDIIIFGISGSLPLNLIMELACSGKKIGLANKECIICLGKRFLQKSKKYGTKVIPLDSEHNAIFQLIQSRNIKTISKYTLTASGGNFYKYSNSELKKIKPHEAIIHPKWTMGKKISIDSSTMMNKIDAIIHPESIVHGIIEYKDQSSHAFLSQPNMEISISSALFTDKNVNLSSKNLKLSEIKSLNFFEIDCEKFNAINLARYALFESGLVPAILNYSNELLVDLFLEHKILFTDISKMNEKILKKFVADGNNIKNPNIKDTILSFKIVDEYINSNKFINI